MPNIYCPNISALIHTGLASGLTYPAITLETEMHEKMRIYLSQKGIIYIKINNNYVGKILNTTDSRLVIYNPEPHWLTLIKEIESNPAVNIGAKGKESGTCCFCTRILNNPGSIHYGYGPVCADKYGLPWSGEIESKEQITEIF